jgi:uncharacterized protein YegL
MAAAFPGGTVISLPVYLVIDTSASLAGEIDRLNQGMAHLLDSFRSEPIAANQLRIALIRFSSQAEVLLPLTSIDDIESMPELRAEGATNYGAAFALARQLIDLDVRELRTEGIKVHRPLMFFVSDGIPVDEGWRTSLQELQSPQFRAHPTIIAIGFGTSDPGIMREVGGDKGRAFIISDVISIGDAIGSLSAMLTATVTSSLVVSTATSGEARRNAVVNVPAEWRELSASQDFM